MDTANKIKSELSQIDGLRGIILFAALSYCDRGKIPTLKVVTVTKDDAVVLFQTYGRLLSRAAERQGVKRIEISVKGGEDMYFYRPEFRLSWI